jgi:hypothetical protein
MDLSTKEAALAMGLTVRAVQLRIKRGTLPHHTHNGEVRILASDVRDVRDGVTVSIEVRRAGRAERISATVGEHGAYSSGRQGWRVLANELASIVLAQAEGT